MDDMTDGAAAPADPKLISQTLLDRTGRAIMEDDPKDFADCFVYPHTIQTFEGQIVIPDVAALTSVFHAVRAAYLNLGVTTLDRHCSSATFVTPTLVQAHYESRVLSGSQLVLRPFPALTELHLGEAGWRVGNCQYAITDAPNLVKALIAPLPRD